MKIEPKIDSPLVSIFRRARVFITSGWCQRELAMRWVFDRDAPEGKRLENWHVSEIDEGATLPTEKSASRWSLLGAVEASADAVDLPRGQRNEARELLFNIIKESGFEHKIALPFDVIQNWNDVEGRTQDEVLGMLDRVIEKAEV